MRQVTSPTCPAPGPLPARRWRRAAGAAAVVVALVGGLSAAPVQAEDLVDRQQQVRADMKEAAAEVETSQAAVGAATQALLDSQAKLARAQATLEDVASRLATAKKADAELAVKLAEEQRQLALDTAAVAKGQADVDAQQALIAQAARDAFQQQTGLEGASVAVGAETPGDLAQRIQWDTTVFDTTQARLDALHTLQAALQAARDKQAATEARVAADKATSAKLVASIAALTKQAAAAQSAVAELVAGNEANRRAAQAELDADKARYDQLVADDQALTREIMARASQGTYVTGVPAGQVWTDPATYPMVASGAQVAVSPKGFIRPVAATPGSPFGMRFHPILRYWRMHRGQDWGAGCGVPLYAAQAGRVVHVGVQGGFGNYTIIDHGIIGGQSVMTGYAHQSSYVVKDGQLVAQGQLIGYVGTTGLSTGCHLHLQVYVNGDVVNPMTWIP